VNSRQKEQLCLERHRARGLERITTHALLCIIALLFNGVGALRLGRPEKARSITMLARKREIDTNQSDTDWRAKTKEFRKTSSEETMKNSYTMIAILGSQFFSSPRYFANKRASSLILVS
jgi:hypothetical protein